MNEVAEKEAKEAAREDSREENSSEVSVGYHCRLPTTADLGRADIPDSGSRRAIQERRREKKKDSAEVTAEERILIEAHNSAPTVSTAVGA